jgi:hypothetical protein
VVASGETGTPVVSRAPATIDSTVPTSKPRVSANNDLFIGALLLELIPASFMVRHSKIKYRVLNCNGGGVVDKDTDDERQCPTCGGLGFVHDDDDHEEVIKTSRV